MIRSCLHRLRNTLSILLVVSLALFFWQRGRVGHHVSTRLVLHPPVVTEMGDGEARFLRSYMAVLLSEGSESAAVAHAAARDLTRTLGTEPSSQTLLQSFRLRLDAPGSYEVEMHAPGAEQAREGLRAMITALDGSLRRSLRAYLGERIRRRSSSPLSVTEPEGEGARSPAPFETGRSIRMNWEADLTRKRVEREQVSSKLAAMRRMNLEQGDVIEELAVPRSREGNASQAGKVQALARAEAELADLRELYLPAHPKVSRARDLVETLRRRVVARESSGATSIRRIRRRRSDSPALAQLEGRLALLDAEVTALERLLAEEAWKGLAAGPRPPILLAKEDRAEGRDGELQRFLQVDVPVLETVPGEASLWKSREVGGFGWRWFLLSLGFALVLGAAELSLRRRIRSRLPEVLRRLPVLAALPRLLDVSLAERDEGTLLSDMDPGDRRGDALRLLEARLRASVSARRPLFLALSQGADVGKSVVLAHLAIVMASYDRRVLLVDANMRNPRQHEIFHLGNERGLSDLLVDEDPSDDCLLETSVENLRVLPSGPLPPEPVDLFSAPRCREVFTALGAWADVILVDGSPLSAGPESSLLASMADGSFFVTVPGEELEAVAPMLEDLQGLGHRLIGVVQNRVDRDQALR